MNQSSFIEIATAQPIDLKRLFAPLLEHLELAENPCYRGHIFAWVSSTANLSNEPPIGQPCMCGQTKYGVQSKILGSA